MAALIKVAEFDGLEYTIVKDYFELEKGIAHHKK